MTSHVLHVFSLDTETTGLLNKHNPPAIVDFAAVDVKKHELDDASKPFATFSKLVKPPPTNPIPLVASKIHGIYPEDVADAPTLETVWREFLAWVDDRLKLHYGDDFRHYGSGVGDSAAPSAGAGASPTKTVRVVLLAYNGVGFDFPVIKEDLFRAGGLSMPHSWGFADLLLHVRGAPTWGIHETVVPSSAAARARKLGLLYEHLFGRSFEDAHRAEADAVALAEVYQRVVDTHGVGFSSKYRRVGGAAGSGHPHHHDDADQSSLKPFSLRVINYAELFGAAAVEHHYVPPPRPAAGAGAGAGGVAEDAEVLALAERVGHVAIATTAGGGAGAGTAAAPATAPATTIDVESKTKGVMLHADSPLTEIKGVGAAVSSKFAREGAASTIREAIAFLKLGAVDSEGKATFIAPESVWLLTQSSSRADEAAAIATLTDSLIAWLAMPRLTADFVRNLATALIKVNKKLLAAAAAVAPTATA